MQGMILMSTRMCIICCAQLIEGYYAGQKTTATSLSERYNLNIRTLNPSLNKMTHAGILRSQVGGVDRGYILARDPKLISIYDIIESVQGFDYMRNCKESIIGASCKFEDCTECSLYAKSHEIVDFARERFKEVSLFDLYIKDKDMNM